MVPQTIAPALLANASNSSKEYLNSSSFIEGIFTPTKIAFSLISIPPFYIGVHYSVLGIRISSEHRVPNTKNKGVISPYLYLSEVKSRNSTLCFIKNISQIEFIVK